MPKIYPFKGWRYNPNIVNNLSKVVSPPYDVISENDQRKLYDLSPYNFVRIILNNNPLPNKYADSARMLSEWKTKNIIQQDDNELFYLLSQSFNHGVGKVNRIGFISKLQISPLGEKILPHEQTISKHINDRYELMKSTDTNTGQIFMSYRDEKKIVEGIAKDHKNKEPIIDINIDGTEYKIWPLNDNKEIDSIKEMMKDKKVIIADGHHRYKTALQYAQDYPEKYGSDKVMVTFVNAYNKGMNVLPTHRIVHNKQNSKNNLLDKISHVFTVKESSSVEDLLLQMKQSDKPNIINIGMISNSKNCYLLSYNGRKNWDKNLSDASQSLDVNILHNFILKSGCGIDTNNQNDLNNISYIRGNESPLDLINTIQEFDYIFLLNSPNLDHIFEVAESGETMPQKSTYFFPKVYSGLIFASIGDK
tara:strand:+ start:9414 stop:10673 length:1260 start_codon:yes stop_codon:yes gene_type:complete